MLSNASNQISCKVRTIINPVNNDWFMLVLMTLTLLPDRKAKTSYISSSSPPVTFKLCKVVTRRDKNCALNAFNDCSDNSVYK